MHADEAHLPVCKHFTQSTIYPHPTSAPHLSSTSQMDSNGCSESPNGVGIPGGQTLCSRKHLTEIWTPAGNLYWTLPSFVPFVYKEQRLHFCLSLFLFPLFLLVSVWWISKRHYVWMVNTLIPESIAPSSLFALDLFIFHMIALESRRLLSSFGQKLCCCSLGEGAPARVLTGPCRRRCAHSSGWWRATARMWSSCSKWVTRHRHRCAQTNLKQWRAFGCDESSGQCIIHC